ncbi:aldehyde dehydrogenase (NADP(+)) [Inquilinus sp. KBS0705]|nr:aldehyde dehydrogenase (NADP(+)) [Inquilinus sp. KBS0705]
MKQNHILESIKGANFIGYERSANSETFFRAVNPTDNSELPGKFHFATSEEMEHALSLAGGAFDTFRNLSGEKKSSFLISIAEEIMTTGSELIERAIAESGLSESRIISERHRTCQQLRFFANLLMEVSWKDVRIDTEDKHRAPIAKPDIRRTLVPIGPVAVFGASNFPLAFSTAGGDTASALAAGCPVIVKAHPSHPGTHALVSLAIVKAAIKCGLPEGVFSALYLSNEDSQKLITSQVIKAVGFTGSRNAGNILIKVASERKTPIPVYAEMSSVNPVVLLPGALKEDYKDIATQLIASVSLGAGQFCTNPGLVLLIDDASGQKFLLEFECLLRKTNGATMLNKGIFKNFIANISSISSIESVKVLGTVPLEKYENNNQAKPIAFSVDAESFLTCEQLQSEIFGPSTLVVLNKDINQLLKVIDSLDGQLTATIHASAADNNTSVRSIIDAVTEKAGRIVFGGYPTGVEVCHAMQHGGPFPSSSDSKFTSVGSAAILRFVRPVAFQNFPDDLLPLELRNDNPGNILRLVNGELTKAKIIS